ncbi:GrdX family protein [uncultured Brachyspira sp.]|uniref:GrdX family protein n=1 Tax=uncultured Brachyspira sp. TaxID=221953 RepID=UPI0025FD1410|nr:GrdX family protein [uncultured Brachyspira sp.]
MKKIIYIIFNMNYVVVTNNPKIFEEVKSKNAEIIYMSNSDFMEVLYKVRDFVHLGYKLLTHPIVSSIKPYETPYKSVALSKGSELDLYSLELIENSIELTKNFLDKPKRKLTKEIDDDFRLIDYKLVIGAIESIL